MERDDRRRLRALADDVAGWVSQAALIKSQRETVERAADEAVLTLRRAVVEITRDGAPAWRVLPLREQDAPLLADLAEPTQQPPLGRDDERVLGSLCAEVMAATRDVSAIVGARRFFSGSKRRDAGQAAADFLIKFHQWAIERNVPGVLARLGGSDAGPRITDADTAARFVALAPGLRDLGHDPQVVGASSLADLRRTIQTIEGLVNEEAHFRAAAVRAGNEIRRSETRKLLQEMPVERLKDATRDRLLVRPLAEAGITSVQAVLDLGKKLEYLPGIGGLSATRLSGAAQTLWQTTFDEMPTRIDIRNRTALTTELLRRLRTWDAMRQIKGATADLRRSEALAPLARRLDSYVTNVVVFAVGRHSAADFRDDVDAVRRWVQTIPGASSAPDSADPWQDFLARPADYFAMLAELGFLSEDEQKAHGDLPDDIVQAIRALELDTQHLSVSLRGYQSFAARFGLVQRKVIIGDEMGLGKTVEALAVIAHLRAKGAHHALVICPAAVVTNWVREVAAKSLLRPHRAHGQEREIAARNWIRHGGVAITTFETLAWFADHVADVPVLGCVVVDEAHLIKNPDAQRSLRANRVIAAADRAILLTGTPLENRIDEFRNLVGYLRPDLVVDATELAPRRFRKQVAPVYLRRNQEDVLTELPELVEVDEWLPMSPDDASAYRDAVAAGNFAAMRQAAMLQGRRSAKMQRLIEIVGEAEENGRRVIVFSYFRGVLDEVVKALRAAGLPGRTFGPLTGSVPAGERQVMVDQFSAAGHGAVLVTQIVAGGVGLNIQAASVVVICEPQLTPTTEWQAVARARRMGQLESVQVHRLLSEEGVDQRVRDILARKRELFNDFARISETAGSAPEAFDLSEAELARDVVAAERERLFSRDMPGFAADSAP